QVRLLGGIQLGAQALVGLARAALLLRGLLGGRLGGGRGGGAAALLLLEVPLGQRLAAVPAHLRAAQLGQLAQAVARLLEQGPRLGGALAGLLEGPARLLRQRRQSPHLLGVLPAARPHPAHARPRRPPAG